MSRHRPFRFSVQDHTKAPSAAAWRARAVRSESAGFSTLFLPDQFADSLGPIAALMAAAAATTKLRIGLLVFDNDYRHPAVLAREAATLDLLSDGRLDFGLGAGWLASDYAESGIPYDPPGRRIERMEEALAIIKALFSGRPVTFTGKHYRIDAMEAAPLPVQRPHPPIVIGGGGRRMLGIAAREANIVNINFDLREGRVSRKLVGTGRAEATDEKIGWIREAAGSRIDEIELSVTIFLANVTDDRESVAAAIGGSVGLEPAEALAMPHFLIGTVDQLVDDLQARRERYGISHIVVPGEVAESLEPLVERLTGR